jgi:hypothetical protein
MALIVGHPVGSVAIDGLWAVLTFEVYELLTGLQLVDDARYPFSGRNRAGWLRWSRMCEVLAVDAPHELVWRTIPTWRFVDSSDWRIRLDRGPRGQPAYRPDGRAER